ncbi:MAG: NADP-dependent isocitrate dehydrogenase [Bacteriovoracaceae bacterium]
MSDTKGKIYYTITDEAPYLATQSFLPIVKAFTSTAGIEVETKDISLSGRVIAQFPERLNDDQKIGDALTELGELAKTPKANIIKLPNISASIPQLKACISELQVSGYNLPDFPEDPCTEEEKEIRAKYAKVLGSAVNPVLREGNSDRRVAGPVKEFAKANPHSMGEWSSDSKSHVASMTEGDFYSSEKSVRMENETDVRIEFVSDSGESKVLKESTKLLSGEVLDCSVMNTSKLRSYFQSEIEDCKNQGLLLSLHFKATMMKVSDPIMFGHALEVYFKDVFEKYSDEFDKLGVNSRLGLGDLFKKIEGSSLKGEITALIEETLKNNPDLAMVDSDNGITNLHVPSDVIIDASMPAMIRSSGKMWGPDGKLHDTKALIPDRSYAGVYQKTVEFCKEHGAFDPKTMGNVSNVGLMAKKAEEYGSHDKTFEIEGSGKVLIKDASGNVLMEQTVEKGDIWRACQTKDIAIKDWVRLAVSRAKATNNPVVFWLDEKRAHDANLIKLVNQYLGDHDTNGLEVKILAPTEAAAYSLERVKAGADTISATGNVLRDYLTDLFPILELGTSAKMLSIVPLLAGGGLYETGAGGSAPKHVQQFTKENHLRWDSLGEFLALGVSIEDLSEKTNNSKAKVLAAALDKANSQVLSEKRSPSRKVGEMDNRGSHFYLALYWAKALSEQTEDGELQSTFSRIASELEANESEIISELNKVQGTAIDMGGYYRPDVEKVSKAMRPCEKLNQTINSLL